MQNKLKNKLETNYFASIYLEMFSMLFLGVPDFSQPQLELLSTNWKKWNSGEQWNSK